MFAWLKHKKRSVYLDAAAATPVRDACIVAMQRVYRNYGNPGAKHRHGELARAVLEDARACIASVCGVTKGEIVFTSGATEANNSALRGIVAAHTRVSPGSPVHVVTSSIEHSSVASVINHLSDSGLITYTEVAPDAHGTISPDAVSAALTPHTRIVSIGWMNGEIGTVQPLRAITQEIRAYEKKHKTRIYVHTDAGQSAFVKSLQPHGVGVDLMTISSGKLYGPRGVAALYIKRDTLIDSLLWGGAQEHGLRPGTEDPVLATGFATALEHLERARASEYAHATHLRNVFKKEIMNIPGVIVNGDGVQAPHIFNISVPNIDAEYVMLALDFRGVSISTKSVCIEATGEPESHVVKALGGPVWRARNTLRFSWSYETTDRDIRYAVRALHEVLTMIKEQSQE